MWVCEGLLCAVELGWSPPGQALAGAGAGPGGDLPCEDPSMPKTTTTRVTSWCWKRPRRGRPFSRQLWVRHVLIGDQCWQLTHTPWVGIYRTAMWDEARSPRFQRAPDFSWRKPDVKKKTAMGSGDGGRHLAAMETSIFAQLLPLVEHCAMVRYDDDDPRLPGWIRMGVLGAAWTLDVKDPDTQQSFRVVDSSLDKAWEAAALVLACDQAPFAADPYAGGPKGEKKK